MIWKKKLKKKPLNSQPTNYELNGIQQCFKHSCDTVAYVYVKATERIHTATALLMYVLYRVCYTDIFNVMNNDTNKCKWRCVELSKLIKWRVTKRRGDGSERGRNCEFYYYCIIVTKTNLFKEAIFWFTLTLRFALYLFLSFFFIVLI